MLEEVVGQPFQLGAMLLGEEIVEQIRVLENGSFKVFERTESDAKWIQVEAGRTSLPEIPIATTYSEKKATFISEPPLLDVAYINLAHYRLQVDISIFKRCAHERVSC